MPTAFPDVLPDTDVQQQESPPFPPFAVVLHDDEKNAQLFVVAVLMKVFAYPVDKCQALMSQAEEHGRVAVWVGPLEVAELKADQVVGCGPTPFVPGAEPLRVTVEPVG